MFLLSADNSKLTVLQKELITSGAINVYDVKFQFDSDWDEMSRWAVFRVGSLSKCIELDDTNKCKIPWECLRENDIGKILYAGVYGMKGETITLPTIWARMGEIMEGAKLGDTVLPPTPSMAEQILHQVLAARDEVFAAISANGGIIPDSGGTDEGGGSDEGTNTEPEVDGDVATDEEVDDLLGDIFGN